jgi:energy-coupling factor transporter ATP-binding protein EcfA2
MQLLWFLPSLAYGVMLGVTSNNYFLAASTVFTILIALLVRYRLSKRPKLSANTKLRVINRDIWLDDFRMPRGEIFWSAEQADFIFERLGATSSTSSAMQDFFSKNFERSKTNLNMALGFNETEVVQRSLVEDGPHAILIGSTGSGKTELLRQMLRELNNAETKPGLVCVDFKGGLGLEEFRLQSLRFASDHDMGATEKVFDWLELELSQRELSPEPRNALVIAIDELTHLLGTVKRSSEVLAAIAARGRSARMHLILTNQNLVGVHRALLSNIKLRVLIGNPDPVDAAMLGQLSRAPLKHAVQSLASAQIVAHASAAQSFYFALPGFRPEAIEQNLALLPVASEPRQRQRSKEFRREYSNQAKARHRRRRQTSILGLRLLAHRGGSR